MTSGAERQAPQCTTCQVVFTVKHMLLQCPVFSNERRANLLLNLSLSDILGEDGRVENVLKFLKDIGYFYDI